METKTYSIPNIHCMHCVNRIQQAIQAIEALISLKTDLASLSLTVDFEAPADDQTIRQTLEAIGYPATAPGEKEHVNLPILRYDLCQLRSHG